MSIRSEHLDRMSIGEFAKRSRLSAKALRLYHELGLLRPAQVSFAEIHDWEVAWALGKEFVGPLRRSAPQNRSVSPKRQLVSQSLHARGDQHAVRPTELGSRITYLANAPVNESTGPDCDFAVPFTSQPPA